MKFVSTLWILALCAGLGCSKEASVSGAPKAPAPFPVTVAPVVIQPVDRTLPIVGTLYAKDSALVSAEVEGKVERTLVEFGDRVKAGQELAWIDTDSYTALAHQAEARVEQSRALAHGAEQELHRQQVLLKTGIAWAAPWNKNAFEAKAVAETLKGLGASNLIDSKDISITAPDIAENGAIVPVAVTSRIPNTGPESLTAIFIALCCRSF
jgi:multidrug efflux pump subunit AcrA (membrane-fusion protein)